MPQIVVFDPPLGTELQKMGPASIVPNDIANRHSHMTIVAAISSRFGGPLSLTEGLIQPPKGGFTRPSIVLLN
jgi:mRNA interferase MazF